MKTQKASLIEITSSSMPTYWYADKIGLEVWAEKIFISNEIIRYRVLGEDYGKGCYIIPEDCEVIREGKVKLKMIVEEIDG